MNLHFEDEELRGARRWTRLAVLLAMGLAALGLREIDPASLRWLPLHPSCGAITGLPCVFCGTTRALHHLLNGHFARAVYFNWLAFPVALIAALAGVKLMVEWSSGHRIMTGLPLFRFTPRVTAGAVVTLLVLWTLQVSLALALHKHELLNPHGLLYGLVVR